MKLPASNKEWLLEIQKAFKSAYQKYEGGSSDIHEKEDLYKMAPLLTAEYRNIEDDKLISEMCEETKKNVERDFSLGQDSRKHYRFHFVISYIHAHVPAGILTALEGDRIMDYINDNWNLFE